MINFIGLNFLKKFVEVGGVAQIAKVKKQFDVLIVRIGIDMINTTSVKGTGPAYETMHFIVFFQQKLRQIRAVLSCDSRDKRPFCHMFPYTILPFECNWAAFAG